MKIGILSFTSTQNNYGQLLQCYALQTYLNQRGFDAVHIPFYPKESKISRLNSPKKIAEYLNSYLNWRSVINKVRKITAQKGDNARKFDEFRLNAMKLYPTKYQSIDELRNNPPQVDALIAGSDQIWGSALTNPDTDAWFLKFGDRNTRRISYAASIGRQIESSDLPLFKRHLTDFDYVSVREEGARKVCEKCGVDAQVVLDPTLLLEADDYQRLINEYVEPKTSHQPYLFAYILNVLFASDIHWAEFEEYALGKGYKVKPVYSSGYYTAYPIIPGHTQLEPTIPEWLSLIRDASCVVTTSFHGVVFCILFKKPFISLPLPDRRGKGNDRVATLLKSVGLEDRIFNPKMSVSAQMDAPIDWASAHKKLSKKRLQSQQFLDAALL